MCHQHSAQSSIVFQVTDDDRAAFKESVCFVCFGVCLRASIHWDILGGPGSKLTFQKNVINS